MDSLIALVPQSSIAILVALIALIGAVFGAIMSYSISRRSSFINSVTVERSKWINELRINIANLSAEALIVEEHMRENYDEYIQSKHYRESMERMNKLTSLVKLQLNPFGEIDKNILQILNNEGWTSYHHLLIAHSQWLLKAEWEKVKWEASGFFGKLWLSAKSLLRIRQYRKFLAGEGHIKLKSAN